MNYETEITAIKVQLGNIERRLDENSRLTESVHKLALSLEKLTSAQKATDIKVDTLGANVEEIKSKPQKRWEIVITALITAAVTFLASGVLK